MRITQRAKLDLPDAAGVATVRMHDPDTGRRFTATYSIATRELIVVDDELHRAGPSPSATLDALGRIVSIDRPMVADYLAVIATATRSLEYAGIIGLLDPPDTNEMQEHHS